MTLVLFFVEVDGNLLDLKCGRFLYSNSLRVTSFGVGTRNFFSLKNFYFSHEKNLQKNTKAGFLSKFPFISLFFASLIAKIIIKRKKTMIIMRIIHSNCGIPPASAKELAL